MLRGSQRKMIVVRTRDSRLFEEAYFVMRRDAEEREAATDGEDMLWEANRLLESSMAGMGRDTLPPSRPLPQGLRFVGGLFWFMGGLLTGGGIASLLWVLL